MPTYSTLQASGGKATPSSDLLLFRSFHDQTDPRIDTDQGECPEPEPLATLSLLDDGFAKDRKAEAIEHESADCICEVPGHKRRGEITGASCLMQPKARLMPLGNSLSTAVLPPGYNPEA